jgi:hypothetical protein
MFKTLPDKHHDFDGVKLCVFHKKKALSPQWREAYIIIIRNGMITSYHPYHRPFLG